MAQSYVPIQTITVGSGGTSTIEFTNIPQNYTDLKMVLSGRTNESGQGRSYVRYRFNGSSSAIYSYKWLFGYDGNTTVGTGDSSLTSGHIIITPAANTTANTFSNIEMYIPNYAGSSNKSLYIDGVSENNTSSIYMLSLCAPIWASTSAITSITLYAVSVGAAEKFVEFTTATLYGIGGTRATGGTITSDSTYTYHTFTSTGTFTALENIKGAEALVIAGGGGGGKNFGGGGGAGGLLYTNGQLLNAGNSYTIAVGAGGTGHTATWTPIATNGSNSSFGSSVAIGGGYGGGYNGSAYFGGGSGGSGGGGSYESSGGSPTSGQGNTGGAGGSNAPGGGGGASAVGAAASGGNGGNGGSGSSTYSVWGYATSTGQLSGGIYYYAGGGGGGSGSGTAGTAGLGGGGAGGQSTGVGSGVAGSAATANTGGGGGGGSWYSGNGANGGSGLVIIRYPN